MSSRFLLALATLSIFSTAAIAADSPRTITGEKFTCTVMDNARLKDSSVPVDARRTLKFVVENFGNWEKAVLFEAYMDRLVDEPTWVDVQPTDSHLEAFWQNTTFDINEETIVITGDADGIDFVKLVIYGDSGFKHGYIRLEKSMDHENGYSPVTCTHKPGKVTQKVSK